MVLYRDHRWPSQPLSRIQLRVFVRDPFLFGLYRSPFFLLHYRLDFQSPVDLPVYLQNQSGATRVFEQWYYPLLLPDSHAST